MDNGIKSGLVVPSIFIWVGFVGAISFMEAWLKFRAPGVTMEIGLGIGRLVFGVLNKVEWSLVFLVVFGFLVNRKKSLRTKDIWFLIPLLVLIAQSVWLLPVLDDRAERIIKGEFVSPSNVHFYYVGLEVIKELSLLVFGCKTLCYAKNE